MEFLGLGVSYKNGPPTLLERRYYTSRDGLHTDEVKVVDVGGTFAQLSSLTPVEQELLATVYHMAHKSTAHLTFGAQYMQNAAFVHDSVPIIDRLLHANLYNVVSKAPTEHVA